MCIGQIDVYIRFGVRAFGCGDLHVQWAKHKRRPGTGQRRTQGPSPFSMNEWNAKCTKNASTKHLSQNKNVNNFFYTNDFK